MQTFEGSIEDVLNSGEYDQGDYVVVKYDELFDLVEQARFFKNACTGTNVDGTPHDMPKLIPDMQRRTNRPLHPVLGGKSPYSEFLPL